MAVLWRVGLFFVVFGVASAVFIIPFADQLPRWEQEFPVRFLLFTGAAAACSLLLGTWVMTRFVDRRPFRSIGLETGKALRESFTGILVGAAWIGASVAILWGAGWATRLPASGQSAAPAAGLALAGVLLAVLLNVIAQQLLLCGYILQTISKRFGLFAAVVVSSALFSGYHAGAFAGDWLPALNVFLAGAVFCVAYGLTRNLWLPMGIHFAWNGLLGPILGLTVSGSGDLASAWPVLDLDGPARFTGGAFGPEGGLVVTCTTAVLIAAALLMLLRRRSPA